MKKYIYRCLIASTLSVCMLTSNIFAFSKTDASIKYNTLTQPIKSQIINKDGTIFVGFRDLFDIIGAEVSWNEVFRRVTAKLSENELIIYVDTNRATFNNKELTLPVGVLNVNGSIYVPLRFVFELFGFDVKWDSENKEVSISNDYGKYILLNEDEGITKENTLTLAQALEKAKINNSNFKNLQDTYSYMEKVRKDTFTNLQNNDPFNLGSNMFPTDGSSNLPNADGYDYLANSLNMLKSIKSTDTQLQNSEINKQIIENTIEYSIINISSTIKNMEMSINLLEKNIEMSKLNIKNLQAKFDYGMISEKELNTAINLQKNSETTLSELKLSLQNQKDVLKGILGTKKDVEVLIEYNANYDEFNKINLEEFINKSRDNDLSIQIVENDIEVAKYNITTNTSLSETEKTRLQNDLNSAERRLNDTKETLDKKIRNAYSSLQKLVDKKDILDQTLQTAISDYEIAVSNYKAGKITLYQVEQAKMGILNAEKDIEENKISFSTALYSFYKPYLL